MYVESWAVAVPGDWVGTTEGLGVRGGWGGASDGLGDPRWLGWG